MTFTFAPDLIKILTTSIWSQYVAACKGVHPFYQGNNIIALKLSKSFLTGIAALMLAFESISILATSGLPS